MTPAQAMDVGSRLIHLLSQQQLFYRQLRDLAHKQTDLVANGDGETLLHVLSGRQRLIDRLTEIGRELEPLRADWERIAELLPESQRKQAQDMIKDVREILGQIIECDARDTEALYQQKERIADDIRSASVGKRMNQAYNAYQRNDPNNQSCFLDTQSD